MKALKIIYGILLILAGVLVLCNPFTSLVAIGCIVGIFLLIGGINNIISAIKEKKSVWKIILGVLTIIVAIIILTDTVGGLIALNTLVIMMACLLMLQGISEIMAGVAANKMGAPGGLMIFSGVLYVILSIMLFMNPITGLFVVEGVIAATLMMQGIDQLMNLS